MAFSVKNPEADRLARELVAATGESLTKAVTDALRGQLDRVTAGKRGRSLADELDEIAERCSSLPVLDSRSPDEILGYDESRLPH